MKNITVSVDDTVYRRARIRAAELDSSVSAMVREFLVEFAGGESDFQRRRNLQDQTLMSIREFRAHGRMTRDEVHDRHAIR